MLKDIKWIRVAIIMFVSLCLLFGGWYLFQNINVKNPIKDTLSDIQGIHINNVLIDKNQVQVNLTFKTDDFQKSYNEIIQKLNPVVKGRQFSIQIKNNPSDEMQAAWNRTYFYIAEAIDKQEYSLIPPTIEKLKHELQLDQANYSMDSQYIYIDLHQGLTSSYILLPRYNDGRVNNID